MTQNASYQIIFLGQNGADSAVLQNLINERLSDLGLGNETIRFLRESHHDRRDPRLPTIAVFFGYKGATDSDHPAISSLLQDSLIIITVVSDLTQVSSEIPSSLRHINAVEVPPHSQSFDRLASLALESFRLLRKERRLFISYKRDDSQSLANQLYNALDARGFDVFIDTRSVPPAVDFQSELWHRLSDSDVVVLIDTPDFRKSRWTTEELAQANATNIQILHLLWPGQPEDGESSFSHFHMLVPEDFANWSAPPKSRELKPSVADVICGFAEKLRARAIAARHRYIVDSFCDAAREHGLSPNVQPQRWISVELSSGKELAVVPTIGVPTSDRINYVFDAISGNGGGTAGTWVLYDSRGMLASWSKHLEWLDGYLPARSIKMVSAYDALAKEAK